MASSEDYPEKLLATLGAVLWRRYNDAIVHAFVSRHLAELAPMEGMLLKTDLFEEALGNDGIERASPTAIVGIDVTRGVLRAAHQRAPNLPLAQADVRALPFANASLVGVVSTSTLDHFRDPKDLDRALFELARVLRPGGKLILTLDNPRNPLLALRNAIPHAARRILGITPYFVGYTCGPGRLGRLLGQAGFRVTETAAILHFPRVLADLAGTWMGRCKLRALQPTVVSWLARMEALGAWPTRWCTGHYIAVVATKT